MAGAGRGFSVALDRFQQEVLAAFFERQEGFFLTGGGALAGYYLDHRSTQDLDLFTSGSSLDEAEASLAAVARALGADLEAVHTAPDFRRRLLRRSPESVIVDLVLDRTAQISVEKRHFGRVVVDSPEEIRANKLCTLLSRSELRDLADLRALEAAGYAVDATALRDAASKDGGLTPGQLAWVLNDFRITSDSPAIGEATPAELSAYKADLVRRLVVFASPA
ncbi:MAG: hypothetical protein QG573_1757 [Acidobacteriota bacterium]|nr:hypothetical protein [Acidobacteriota bacterium]